MEPTSIALTVLFKAPHFAQALGGMLGLMETVDAKVDRLLRTDFDVATSHLEDLKHDLKPETVEFLLREAWKRFAAAILLEEGERRAKAYIGLAFTQYHLGEQTLALQTLSQLTQYKYTAKSDDAMFAAKTVGISAVAGVLGFVFAVPAAAAAGATYLAAKNSPEFQQQLKNKGKQLLKVWIESVPLDQRVEALKREANEFIESEKKKT